MPREFADPYAYPDSCVLRNKPGIRDAQAPKDFEYEHVKYRTEELRDKPTPGRFDLAHLKAIHAYLFQDVYEWAGEVRTVNIDKGGSTFARPAFIEGEARRISTSLAKDNYLQGLDKARCVERLAHYHTEWGVASVP